MSRKNKRKMKSIKNGNNKRCLFSNRLIGNKEVVLVDYAVDYVKTLGYSVVPILRI